MSLSEHGWQNLPSQLDTGILDDLTLRLFRDGQAGKRCLLDEEVVKRVALRIRCLLIEKGLLKDTSVAIQAIAFNKTASTNWTVAWHQDLMFPLEEPAQSGKYTLSCEKDGVPFARPSVEILEQLLAVRLSLDPCSWENGPLRVVTGSHLDGVIPTGEISDCAARGNQVTCLNQRGDLLLMRPLLLHASSKASSPHHRRILHLVFHDGPPPPERWHRAIGGLC